MNQLHDTNTEMAILGAVLLEKDAYLTASDTLTGSDFYDEKNGLIFDACGELFATNSPIDMLTVSTQLRKAGRLTAAGGSFYLTQCTDKVASAANLKYHTATIKELSIRRNLVAKLTRLNQQAGQITIDLDSILESTSTLIDDVLQNVANKAQILALKDNVAQYIDKVANDQKNIGQSDKKRLSPSIGSLAEFIPEWAPGELIIIAGRPGMAKTSVAIDQACELAYLGYPSYFASLEMTARELAGRVVQRESGLTRYDFERKMTPDQWAKIEDAAHFLADKKIFIDDTPLASLNHIKIKAKLLKQTQGIRAVFIDYLQLITPADKKQIREQQVAEITKQLKAVAKELQLPVFLLAQLNREVENRPGKRPQLSDLRESGAIEQDADVIIFPVRPEYYDKEDPALKGKVIFIVAKNRGGATGEVMAHCNESVTRFSDEVAVNYDYYNNLNPF